jgi:hypothetical protein
VPGRSHPVENYFNYFTEIEEHFLRRRGGGARLSTLDWSLIETWKDAGIPLAAVLRGIDVTFEHYERQPAKTRKINGLAWCVQEVLAAAEEVKEASVGAPPARPDKGFDAAIITEFLRGNARQLDSAHLPSRSGIDPRLVAQEVAIRLKELADEIEARGVPARLEDLERQLAILEEKVLAVLSAALPDDEVLGARAQADRDLAPYCRKMPPSQLAELRKQYVHKQLLEKFRLPRLSLFYM